MNNYTLPIQIRWADIDANSHLRHSVYFDYAAAIRIRLLSDHGLTTKKLDEIRIGPILFREEALFKKEVRLEDSLTIDVELLKATANYSRWSIRHNYYKNSDILCTVVNIDGAWLDLDKRKLAEPNDTIINAFDQFPKAADFELIVPKIK
jgi:acyl-CoA thioester hydrolase